MTLRRILPGLALGGLVLIAAPAVRAHDPNPTFGGSTWADHQALTFRWRSGAEPTSQIKTAIRAAADDNDDSRDSRAATFAYASGGPGLVGYGPGATCGVNGLLASTSRTSSPALR